MSKLDIPKAHLLGVKSSSGGHFDGQNFLKGFPKILPSAKERKVTLMHFEGVLLALGQGYYKEIMDLRIRSMLV